VFTAKSDQSAELRTHSDPKVKHSKPQVTNPMHANPEEKARAFEG
jgi:hypothetical protein